MGTKPPPQKEGRAPQFSAHFYCCQTAGCIKMPLSVEVGPSSGDFVLDGDPPPSPKSGQSPPPQFSAHFYCDQTAGCNKMPLGMEISLSLGNFVLDGDPALSPKRGRSPSVFGQCLLWPNGWMDYDATCYGGRSRPRRLCSMGTQLPQKKGTPTPTEFLAHVYCRQMAGWIKMPLDTEVGLNPGDIVFDGDPAAP